MQQWEYLSLIWSEAVNADPRQGVAKVHAYLMNDAPVRDAEMMKVSDFINALGFQGWEMVGCGNIGVDRHCLYFKRPAQLSAHAVASHLHMTG